MRSHTFPVLYHASAQPRRRQSKNMQGGLEWVLGETTTRVLEFHCEIYTHMHTYIQTYIHTYIHK